MCPEPQRAPVVGDPLLALQNTLYSSRNPTRRWLHCSRRDWILRCIAQYGAGSKKALEVGPGCGVYLPALAQVAAQVTAADVEQAFLDSARELARVHSNIHCVEDDITQTSLAPDSYDLILCSEVIEHIADSPAALAGLSRLLAADGVLILSTPQRFSPLELCAKVAFLPGVIPLVRWLYREPVLASGHINLLTERHLRGQLQAAGLQIVAQYKSGFYLPLVAEFGGERGRAFLLWCEGALRGSRLSWMLWTQYYVLQRASP